MGEITGDRAPLDELIAQVNKGDRIKFLHFWGHRPKRDGTLGPS